MNANPGYPRQEGRGNLTASLKLPAGQEIHKLLHFFPGPRRELDIGQRTGRLGGALGSQPVGEFVSSQVRP